MATASPRSNSALINSGSVSTAVDRELVLCFSPLLFDGILQGRYNDGLSVLPLTLVYCIWFNLMTVAQNYLWIAEKGNWATFANASGLLVNILLNMILIPTIGLHGAVMATAIGNATLVVLMYGLNHRSGCRADVGIWLCAGLPLLLLMSQSMTIVALILVGLLCVSTNLLLSAEEKSDLQLIARKKLGRYLPR